MAQFSKISKITMGVAYDKNTIQKQSYQGTLRQNKPVIPKGQKAKIRAVADNMQ